MKIHYSKLLILFFLAFLVSANTLSISTDYADLAKEHAPALWFDSEEQYFPCDYSNLFYTDGKEITGNIAKQKYELLSDSGKMKNFEVFYKVFEEENIIIQYHLFYAYNDFFNKHYGDAETITVILDENKTVIGSAHIGNATKIILANNMASFNKDENVTVLVEKGSHANYPDKDGNGLAGARELDNWYNAYGIIDRTKEDVFKGLKVNDYKLTPLSVLEDKVRGQGLTSESLGWQFEIKGDFLGFRFNKVITIPIGGKVADISTSNLIANNPSYVMPFTLDFLFKQTTYNYSEQNPEREDIAEVVLKEIEEEVIEEEVIEEAPVKNTYLEERKILLGLKKKLDDLQIQVDRIAKQRVKGISISKLQRLRIVELASGVQTASNEYIRIYNPNSIDLKIDDSFKLYIVSSTNKKTKKTLEFNIQTIPAKEYILIYAGDQTLAENISAVYSKQLAKTGGVILEYREEIMDMVSYGETPPSLSTETKGVYIEGGLKTNYCLIRKKDTDNNEKDFLVSQNCLIEIQKDETDETQEEDDDVSKGGGENTESEPEFFPIIINEIEYNPKGLDLGREWIEIYNDSDSSVDLSKWKFNENGTMHRLEAVQGSMIIPAKEYGVITKNKDNFLAMYPLYSKTILKSTFSLKNTSEPLALYNETLMIDEYTYSSSTGGDGNGHSLQLISGVWKESIPTPGEKNIFKLLSTGSSIMHTLNETTPATSTEPIATTTNPIATTTPATSTNPVIETASSTATTTDPVMETASSTATTTDPVMETPTTTLYINEVMYSVKGPDTGREWIELYSQGDINIEDYKFFENGVNHKISISQQSTTSEYILIVNDVDLFLIDYPNCTSTIATSSFELINSVNTLAIKKNGEIIDEFTYNKLLKDLKNLSINKFFNENIYSLQLIENEWKESIPTPGEENVFKLYPKDLMYGGMEAADFNWGLSPTTEPTNTTSTSSTIPTTETPTSTEPVTTTTDPVTTTTEPVVTTTDPIAEIPTTTPSTAPAIST